MNWRWLILAFVLFYPAVLFGGAWAQADYSHISQYISELNATGSAWSWQIGYFGFIPLGMIGFALLLAVAPRTRLTGVSYIGYWLLAAEPIAYVGSALAPCDLGCPSTGSLSQNIHSALSVITLVMTTAGLMFLFFNERLSPTKRIGWLVLTASFVTLYVLALIPELASWRGLLQRLAEGILYGCLCGVGWRLLAARSRLTGQNE